MDEQEGSDDSKEGEEEKKSKHKRSPDRKAHQLELQQLTSLIHEKEAYLRSLGVPKTTSSLGNREALLSKLQWFKGEIEKRQKHKQVIEDELKGLSQQLHKKAETCGKLQVTLRYKDEQRTNEAIKRLEKHLSTQQLKLSEEKKLVSEIDTLRRSKKNLSAFLAAKQDVDQLRHKQSHLRAQRDNLIRETRDLKGKENAVKISLESMSVAEDNECENEKPDQSRDREAIKKEIDALYMQRRDCQAVFKQEIASYQEEQRALEREIKANERQKREEKRLLKIHTATENVSTFWEERQPYEEEQAICECLTKYLAPLKIHYSTENEEPAAQAVVVTREVSNVEIEQEGLLLVKKNDKELQGLFAAPSRRIGRKGSKKGRKTKDFSQKLVLHPHVFEQFLKLKVEPPSTYADVERALGQLQAKKEFYQKAFSETQEITQPFQTKLTSAIPTANIAPKITVSFGSLGTERDICSTTGDAEVREGNTDERVVVTSEIVEPDAETDNKEKQGPLGTHRTSEDELQHADVPSGLTENDTTELHHSKPAGQSGTSGDIPEEAEVQAELARQAPMVNMAEESCTADSKDQLGISCGTEDNQEDIGTMVDHVVCSLETLDLDSGEMKREEGSELIEPKITGETISTFVKQEILRNEENDKIAKEDILRGKDERADENCLMQSTVITDTLEKGLDSPNLKESSKEIEVRAT